jgi:hypothetical protein
MDSLPFIVIFDVGGEEKERAIELWKREWEAFVEDVVRECESVGARSIQRHSPLL